MSTSALIASKGKLALMKDDASPRSILDSFQRSSRSGSKIGGKLKVVDMPMGRVNSGSSVLKEGGPRFG